MTKGTPKKRISDIYEDKTFHISSVDRCPIYNVDDRLELRGHFLFAPVGRPTCLTLLDILLEKRAILEKKSSKGRISPFKCSGCEKSSVVTLNLTVDVDVPLEFEEIIPFLQELSFFKLMRENDIRELVPDLKITSYNVGETIIVKGEPIHDLYVILDGEVEVLIDDASKEIASKGRVFGELSLLSGGVTNETVNVTSTTKVITLRPERFKHMVNHFPKLQQFFFQLLSKRINESDISKLHSTAEIQGNLEEWKLPDVLQTINMNKKTGLFELVSGENRLELIFVGGEVCSASTSYDVYGVDAFFHALNAVNGSFSFLPKADLTSDSSLQPIGDFMFLMVEGLVRSDEQNSDGE